MGRVGNGPKRSEGEYAALRVWKAFDTRRAIWGVIFFLVTTIVLSTNFLPDRINVKAGDVSNRQIKAPQGAVYVSEVLTKQAQDEAASKVDPIFKLDQSVLDGIDKSIATTYSDLSAIIADGNTSNGEKVAAIQDRLNHNLPQPTLEAFLQADAAQIQELQTQTQKVIRDHMEKGIQQEALDNERRDILGSIEELDVQEEFKPMMQAVVTSAGLKPNLVPDEQSTTEKKQQAIATVQPVQVTIKQGEEIVGDGEIVTEEDVEALQHLGVLRSHYMYLSLAGLAFFIAVIYFLIFLYLYRYNREIIENERKYLLLGLLMTAGVLLDKGIVSIKLGSNPDVASLIGYMVPTAAISMLVAVLLDRKLALFTTFVLSIFAGILMSNSLPVAGVSFIGGTVGVYSVSEISERMDLTRASLYIMLANVLSIGGVTIFHTNSLTLASAGALVGLTNGVLSSVLTIGALPFLENVFGITTSVRMLELSNPNQPVLKRLLLEAPGTYHHSIMVANLAEGAANATGADPLLTRVGAYYHDIGKLKRPYFFIENQFASENPHDKLSPNLSTLIITSHIKDGVELAREYGLPQSVVDIIDQHHGTGLVTYFYHKALEGEHGQKADELSFRYEGPKPRTKEAAIVMLADSVEAAVRALPGIGQGRLEGCVRKIIKDKLEDGQLEEADLTFKELDVITRAFAHVLNGIFHSRIEYPEVLLQEMEGKKREGDNPKQYAAKG